MQGESLRDDITVSFLKQGKKRAITFLREGRIETEITYLQMHHDSNRLAHEFQKLGIKNP